MSNDESSDSEEDQDIEDGLARESQEESLQGSGDSDPQTSSDDEDDNSTFRYTRENFNPNTMGFEDSEIQVRPEFGVDEHTTPYNILQKFLTKEIMQEIVAQTNLFANQVKQRNPTAFSKWKPVTEQEMWRFLSVCIMMGIVKKPSISDYWCVDEMMATPSFGKIMSRNRYENCIQYLFCKITKRVYAVFVS